jgi:hypothetical protein
MRGLPDKDRDALLAFYDFPGDWEHLRMTNVIESSAPCARGVSRKRCSSSPELLKKNWRRLDGHNQLPKGVLGVQFTHGVEVGRGVRPRDDAQAGADRVGRDHDHRIGRARGGPGRGGSLDAHRALNDRDAGVEAAVTSQNSVHLSKLGDSCRSLGRNHHGSCRG